MNVYVLFLSSFALGLKHGFDADHIAAILDIAGNNGLKNSSCAWTKIIFKRAMFYAFGHAIAVFLLGISAQLIFKLVPANLTKGYNFFCEKFVGITLVFFAFWILRNLFIAKNIAINELALSKISLLKKLCKKIFCRESSESLNNKIVIVDSYSATVLGVLHGLGVETATQVLLLSAVSGAQNFLIAFFALGIFVFGLILSNFIIASLSTLGTLLSKRYLLVPFFSAATACFSLFIGLNMLF